MLAMWLMIAFLANVKNNRTSTLQVKFEDSLNIVLTQMV